MFAAVQWFLHKPADNMSPAEKLVMAALINMAKVDGTCFPGQAYLAQVTGLGERTVRRALKSLTDQKWISRKHRWRGDRPTSDLIVIHWPPEIQELIGYAGNRPTGPVTTGHDGRQTDQIEPNRLQKEEQLEDYEMVVAIPQPGDLYPTRNKISDLAQTLRGCVGAAIAWDEPGIQNLSTLRAWAAVYDLNFLVAVMLDVAIKHSRSSSSNGSIKSWKYFMREIDDRSRRAPQSVRTDPDGYWRLRAGELVRRHRAH